MKKWKIGRGFYWEISEHEYCVLSDSGDKTICSLVDYDGEPIKYFKKCRKDEVKEP